MGSQELTNVSNFTNCTLCGFPLVDNVVASVIVVCGSQFFVQDTTISRSALVS